MPSLIYQHVISLVVSLPIRRGPGVFSNVVWEHHFFYVSVLYILPLSLLS